MKFIVYLSGFIVTGYLAVATIIKYFTFSHKIQIEECFWPILLLLGFSFFLPDVRILRAHPQIKIHRYLDIIAVFLLLFITRLLFVNEVSVWLDEHLQGQYSVTMLPIAAGAIQHQPPGDMVLTNLGLWVSDLSIWGLRLHSCLFSALAGSALFGMTKYFSRSRIFALLCMLFFSFHPIVFKYGYEARPISFGLFMELLFISSLIVQIRDISEGVPQNIKDRRNFYISGITFIYLSSLGLQPAFVVGLSALFFAFMSCFNRAYLKTAGLILLGLAVYMPLQIIIFNISPPRFTAVGGLSIIRTLQEFTPENFSVLETYLNPFGYFCFLLFLYFFFISLRRQRPFDLKTGFLIFLTFLFPLTLIPYFKAHIEWELLDRYLISTFPLIFLLFAALWSQIKLEKKWALLSPVLAICLFAAAVKSHEYKDGYDLIYKKHPDLKSAYKAAEENMKPNDLLLSFCLNSEGFCAQWKVAQPFYIKGTPIETGRTPSVEIYRKALHDGIIGENIIFLYQQESSSTDPGEKYQIERFNKVIVYKVPTNANPAQAVIDFLNPYVQSGLAENKIYPEAFAYLIVSYEHLGDEKTKLRLLDIYKKGKTKSTTQNKYMDALFESNQWNQ